MKVIYIAGAFRSPSKYCPGHQDHWGIQQNVMRAMTVALEVWRLGAVALCPHANTAHFQHAAPDDVWLRGDIELLERCDALLLVCGWHESAGARAEKQHAEDKGIPVFYQITEVRAWLKA